MSGSNAEIMFWIIFSFLIIYYAIIMYKKLKLENYEKLEYEKRLKSAYPNIINCDEDLKNNFITEIENYENTNNIVEEIETNIKKYPFPIPLEPDKEESTGEIISKITTLIDKNSLMFAGTEQFILSVFPLEQITQYTLHAMETIGNQSSQLLIESLSSIKLNFAEGISNFQNVDKVIDCLKHFGSHFFENPANLRILEMTAGGNGAKFISSFITNSTMHDIVLPMFNSNECINDIINSLKNHSSEAISEIGNSDFDLDIDPSASFPIIALCMSSIREINLLHDEKTSIGNSMKNILLDVGGTGIGAAGGAELGAYIGTMFGGPIGTIVGGMIGASAGAIAGRLTANKIKKEDFNNAWNNYSSASEKMLKDTKDCAIKSVGQVRSVSINKQNEFKESLFAAPRLDDSELIINIVIKLVKSLELDLFNYNEQLRNFKASKFAKKTQYKKIIQDIDLQLNEIKNLIPPNNEIKDNPIKSLRKIINTPFIRDENFHKELDISFKNLKKLIRNHRATTLAWSMVACTNYNRLLYDIYSESNTQLKNFKDECSHWKLELEKKKELLQIEKDKLGIL